MKELHFSAHRKSFWARLIRPLFASSAFFIAFLLLTKLDKHSIKEVLVVGGFFSLCAAVMLLLRLKFVIDEVKIINRELTLIGRHFNTPWKKVLDIDCTDIKIVSKGNGRGNVDYCLKLYYAEHFYTINKEFNWEYNQLIKLYYVFKEIKQERIAPTEKYLLSIIEKKARGLSSLDIFLGAGK